MTMETQPEKANPWPKVSIGHRQNLGKTIKDSLQRAHNNFNYHYTRSAIFNPFHYTMFNVLSIPVVSLGYEGLCRLLDIRPHVDWPAFFKLITAWGLFLDTIRFIPPYLTKRRLQKEKSPLAMFTDPNYQEMVSQRIKDYYGLEGKCELGSAKSPQDGTAPYARGYYKIITFRFADAKGRLREIPTFYKYHEKPNQEIGELVTLALQERFANLVPQVFTPALEEGSRKSASSQRENCGSLYEFIEGLSLERRFVDGEAERVDTNNLLAAGVVSTIRERLFRIYADPTLAQDDRLKKVPAYRFHKKIVGESLGRNAIEQVAGHPFSSDSEGFLKKLHSSHNLAFDGLNTVLTTGDLQQGNILLLDDAHKSEDLMQDFCLEHKFHNKAEQVFDGAQFTSENFWRSVYQKFFGSSEVPLFVDWDSAEFGTPYHDFFHLAVISDFEKSPEFEPQKAAFLQKQAALVPGFDKRHEKMIEFEVYLSMLNRYYNAAVEKKCILPEKVSGMMRSCKYLLHKSEEAFRELVHSDKKTIPETFLGKNEKTNSIDDVVACYRRFSQENFPLLHDIPYDDHASVAFAHTTYHKHRQKDGESLLQENEEQHIGKANDITLLGARREGLYSSRKIGAPAMATMFYLIVRDQLEISPQSYKILGGIFFAWCAVAMSHLIICYKGYHSKLCNQELMKIVSSQEQEKKP